MILFLLLFEISSAFEDISWGLNSFFKSKTSRPFESVVTICSNPIFCAEDSLCQMIQRTFEGKPKVIHSYNSVFEQNTSFPEALVILLDFEEKMDEIEPNSFFGQESIWLISVREMENYFSAVLDVLEGLDTMDLNSDVYLIQHNSSHFLSSRFSFRQ